MRLLRCINKTYAKKPEPASTGHKDYCVEFSGKFPEYKISSISVGIRNKNSYGQYYSCKNGVFLWVNAMSREEALMLAVDHYNKDRARMGLPKV